MLEVISPPALPAASPAVCVKLTGVEANAEPAVRRFVPLLKVNLDDAPKAPALLN